MKPLIFDGHTHVYPPSLAGKACISLGKFYGLPIDAVGTVDDLMENCRRAGVTGFLMLGVATSAQQVGSVNRYLSECVARAIGAGFEAYAFGGFHQECDPDEVIAEVRELGLSGIKIHPDIQRFSLDDPRMFALCERLEGSFPINFHMGDPRSEYSYSTPEKLCRLLESFPNLTVIASHLGGYHCWERVAQLYRPYPNVYFDCSSSIEYLEPESAETLIRSLGIDRVHFGTDYPICTQREELEVLDRLNFTEEERKAVLWGNIHRILGCKSTR